MSDQKPGASPVAITFAGIATFLGAPAIYSATEPWVTPMLEQSYGHGFTDLYKVAWGIATAALVFFPVHGFFKLVLAGLAAGTILRLAGA